MINVIIPDSNNSSKELLYSYVNNIEGVENVFCYNDLNSIDCDIKNIDIVIFDVSSKTVLETMVIVDELKNKYKNLNFIATSYEINSELVSKVLKQNVCEFILKPVIPNILAGTIKKITDNKKDLPKKKAKTICVFSNKGGSGKTSTAVNMAYEIASQTNEKVCLLDLSFNFGDIATCLDVEPKHTVLSVTKKLEHSDIDLAYTLCEKYRDTSLYVLSFQDDTGLNTKFVTPDLITKLINSLKNIFDYIVIDTLSVIDEASVSIFSTSDLIVLIGMLNLVSIRNCQKCLELFENMGISQSRVKLVLNRYIENSEIKPDDVKETTGVDIFQKIPNNYLTLIDAINLGHAVSEINPHSNIAKAYQNLAREIVNVDYMNLEDLKQYNHGIFNLLRRMGE